MERFILKKLLDWKNSPYRKPLILKGVRQVGKTWILKEFGRRYYENTAYFNFDENEEYKQLKVDIRDILKQLCSYKGVEIIEGHLMPDHIHMLVSIPPKMSVSSFMGYLKGKSALMIFDRHANLKYKFGNRHFWSEGYYVSTVGLNEATIKKYIQDQEKNDIMQDKLGVKEYENPFKG